jgi:hypothetical protein
LVKIPFCSLALIETIPSGDPDNKDGNVSWQNQFGQSGTGQNDYPQVNTSRQQKWQCEPPPFTATD